jgi:cell wall-associated NlpC family hydrolase
MLVLLLLVLSTSLVSCKGKKKITDNPGITEIPANKEMAFRKGIVERARQFVGVKYKYAGRAPETGFDCSGFTSYVLGLYNVKVSPASKIQATEGQAVTLEHAKAGDLVFFSSAGKGGKVTHVALVLDNTAEGILVVHSTSSRGVMVENVSVSKYWKPKLLFARDVISGQRAGQ